MLVDLRLPTGIWYSPGVKANVLFFDKKPASKTPATKEVWVYDLRSNQNFSIRHNPIAVSDLTDFIRCYSADDPTRRKETDLFRRFKYSEIIARDKASLDIQCRQDSVNIEKLSSPQEIMIEILQDLQEAMGEFAAAEKLIRKPEKKKI